MPRRGIRLLVVTSFIALASITPAQAGYGSGQFRALSLYMTDGLVEAYVDGYVGEGTSTSEFVGPGGDINFRVVCIRVSSTLGVDQGCGTMTIDISWPLLSTATVRGTIGSLSIDMTAVARGAPMVSPLVALGPYPIFANTGVILYRPATATGTIASTTAGGIVGTTTQSSLYGLTSVYGSPD